MAFIGVCIIYLLTFCFFIYFSFKAFIISIFLTWLSSKVLVNYFWDRTVYYILLMFIEVFLFSLIFFVQLKIKGIEYSPIKKENIIYTLIGWISYFSGIFIFYNSLITFISVLFLSYVSVNGWIESKSTKVSPAWLAFFSANIMMFAFYLPLILYFYIFGSSTISFLISIPISIIMYAIFLWRIFINFFKGM